MSQTSVEYLYCVVPAESELGTPPTGLGGAEVRAVEAGGQLALVSTLDGEVYGGGALEPHLTHMDWVEPRARAHDRVVTWASDQVATVPMPMWSLFSDEQALGAALDARRDTLAQQLVTLAHMREYVVRVYADTGVLGETLAAFSAAFAQAQHELQGASPGQAYLLQRKIAELKKTEVRDIARQVALEAFEQLRTHAEQTARDPLPAGDGVAFCVLNAAFLVTEEAYHAFRETLTGFMHRYHEAGFRFDFTGPWPAYHFARGD